MTTTSEPSAAIEALGLGKAFGAVKAVDGLDLSVPSGGVFALLGPNGAGKTTTIRIFATLTRPDVGIARVLGHDVTSEPHAVRAGICLTGQFATVDPSLTGTENLVLQGRLLGLTRRAARARTAGLLDAFGLADAAGRPVRTYSGGMQRRLDIAASLVVAPARAGLIDLDRVDNRIAEVGPQTGVENAAAGDEAQFRVGGRTVDGERREMILGVRPHFRHTEKRQRPVRPPHVDAVARAQLR